MTAGRFAPTGIERWQVGGETTLAGVRLAAEWAGLKTGNGPDNTVLSVDAAAPLAVPGGTLTPKLGLRREEQDEAILFDAFGFGTRTDLAGELRWAAADKAASAWVFGQATLERSEERLANDRVGAGADYRLSDRLSFTGEASGGDGGLGADLRLNHRLGEGVEAYVGYALLTDRPDTGLQPVNLLTPREGGTLTFGARQRYASGLSVFGENRVVVSGAAPAYSRSFGAEYEPTPAISLAANIENGRIEDATRGVIERTALGASAGYVRGDVSLGTAAEWREDTVGGQAVTT